MYLKQLEISGFKSFAKKVVLDFPSRITAVVGPNGSGKSNIKEAMQWVLGEQSMKSLRGKKGEDLIWSGSNAMPRMGKASVTLVFDNQKKAVPIDFTEVAIARKIFRDGLNEYLINGSPVRLKDVAELTARMGLGETKHNIIGQGEVDRVLLASSRDRREMLEEALGLRVYRLKKNEAERKLHRTRENMREAQVLIKELTPHLTFLERQAKRAQTRDVLERELHAIEARFALKEARELRVLEKDSERQRNPLLKTREAARVELERLGKELDAKEELFARVGVDRAHEQKRRELGNKRRELEHGLGRLEGRLEAITEQKERTQDERGEKLADLNPLRRTITEIVRSMRNTLLQETDALVLQKNIKESLDTLEQLLAGKKEHVVSSVAGNADAREKIQKEIQNIKGRLEKIVLEMNRADEEFEKEQAGSVRLRRALRQLAEGVRTKREEERDIAVSLERLRFEEERISARRRRYEEDCKTLGIAQCAGGERPDELIGESAEDLRRGIEKFRVKLEEVGGIDAAVMQEYEETRARHTFLTRELEDITRAVTSLEELIKELDGHLRKDFKEGFAKIKEAFEQYFKIIFGGGHAKLRMVKQVRPASASEEDSEEHEDSAPVDETIEIEVALPRKRVQNLQVLSGGERALTSIALLFSIVSVSPPPFLILDETDAALDEANSRRYATILKELAKKTQLLLVTHNRETMKCAGVLYGITMGADGVSKLLSLKLEEAEEYTNR